MTPTIRSRRLVFASAALVCFSLVGGLAACGTKTAAPSPTSVTTVGVGTEPARTPRVIVVQSAPGTGPYSAAGVDTAAADSTMRPMSVTYVYSGAVPNLTEPAASWYFPAGISATQGQIRQLADALGVQGDVTAIPADQGGGWIVGPQDFSAPTVSGSNDSQQSWWYGAGNVVSSVPDQCIYLSESVGPSADSAVAPPSDPVSSDPVSSDGTTIEPPSCEGPTPPVNVPTEGEARAKADALLAAIGLDPANYDEEVYVDDWSASVTAYLKLDGIRTTVSVSFGFGENGSLTWAGGYLGTPVRGDNYPLIGVDNAVQRLNDQSAMWTRYSDGPNAMNDYGTVAVPVAAPSSADADVSGVVSAVEPPPATDPSGGEIVVDPLPPLRPPGYCDPASCETVLVDPIIVTLSNARPSLEQVWADDGTVWLLPGYAFDADDQGIYSVTAVEDQYLHQQEVPVDTALVDTAPIDTTPVDTTPVDTTPVDTTPVDTTPADTIPLDTIVADTVPVTYPPIAGCSTSLTIHQFDPVPLDVTDVQFLIGLCVDDAIAMANGLSFEVRVVREDGVDLPVTLDLRPDRANVVVDGGIVTGIASIG